eukprot:3504313-Rhodomonas_salina.1
MSEQRIPVIFQVSFFFPEADTHHWCVHRRLVVCGDKLEVPLRQFDGAFHDGDRDGSFDSTASILVLDDE